MCVRLILYILTYHYSSSRLESFIWTIWWLLNSQQ